MIGNLDTESITIGAVTSPRVGRITAGDDNVSAVVERAVNVSIEGLRQMFRADDGLFAFTRKRQRNGSLQLQDVSLRYSAISALGGRRLPEALQRRVFGGRTARDYVTGLVARLNRVTNLGDTALIYWAAAESGHFDLKHALECLQQRTAGASRPLTVEMAWTLAALAACRDGREVRAASVSAAERLLGAFRHDSGLFPHYLEPKRGPWYRSHVGSFADQIYPVQALARYHTAFGDSEALAAAAKCAEQLCCTQGADGQWWWHYDVRTGEVIEGYPVYSVHQDSMAPMALMDLREAGGPDHSDAIRRGLRWMVVAPEIRRSLIDEERSVIWRKVARAESRKAVRLLRTLASRVHPHLRLRGFDHLCPPTSVDYECRPYHLAWVLYAWLGGK
ncbi:MAG: hypothetical protein V1790_19565 [Planctomycetota bacterium]